MGDDEQADQLPPLDGYVPSGEQVAMLEQLGEICQQCETRGAVVTVIGGYGLDGLYGHLTRDHGDYDLGVTAEHESTFVSIIEEKGFIFAEKNEEGKTVYKKDELVLEYSTSDRLADFPELSESEIFPEKPNAKIRGYQFRTPTLAGHKKLIEIQNRRGETLSWGEYPHTAHQQRLIKAIDEKV